MTTHARSALGILLWCLLAACLLWAPVVRGQDTDADTIDDGINYEELFHHVWLAVAENYVGPAEGVDWFAAQREYLPKVKSAQSDEEAYRHLAEMVALVGDPLTFLVTPEEMQNAPEALDPSNFSGVGMMLVQFPDDSIVVTEVFDRAPASRAGLRKGHRIVAVNGVSTATRAGSPRVHPRSTSPLWSGTARCAWRSSASRSARPPRRSGRACARCWRTRSPRVPSG